MAFNDFEKATETSQPIELYEITLGGEVFRYTSSEDDRTVDGVLYSAIAIKRSKLEDGPERRDAGLVIEVPGSNTFAVKYVSNVPADPAILQIKRIQRPDTVAEEVVVLFEGRVQSVAFFENAKLAKMDVRPRAASANRPMPRYTYQASCNHVLYDERCKISDADPSFRLSSAVVTDVSGNTVTVSGASGFVDGFFTSGFLELVSINDARSILDHTGDVLTLNVPFPVDHTGQLVNVLAGCDHTIAVCKSKFNNVVNFGGFAFMPEKNIFATGLD